MGTAAPFTGALTTSDPMVNQLQSNIVWGQRGNFLSVPTDTPARDERLGWTGDINVFAETATFNMDSLSFLTKWLADMRDAQSANGLFAKMAAALGRTADAEKYGARATAVAGAFADAYVSADGRVQGDSQTAYVLALSMGLVPAAKRDAAGKRLAERVASRGFHLSTGFLGTPDLVPALSDTGNLDIAYRLLLNRDYPSWGSSVRSRAAVGWLDGGPPGRDSNSTWRPRTVALPVTAPMTVTEGAATLTAATGASAAERATAGVRVVLAVPPSGAVDHADLGDGASEQAHQLKASATSGASTEGGRTRRYTQQGVAGGYFEFDLAVTPGQPFVLRAVETYNQAQTKDYDVLADGGPRPPPFLPAHRRRGGRGWQRDWHPRPAPQNALRRN